MFIGHLPAAYIALKAAVPSDLPRSVFAAGLVGSVAPDADMLWFLLVDSSIHHHHFITHRPLIWIALLALGLLIKRPMVWVFAACAVLHCLLDSIAGDIQWLWPVSDAGFQLVEVQPTHDHWIKSFLSHWTYLAEIAVCLVAAGIWMFQRKRPGKTQA